MLADWYAVGAASTLRSRQWLPVEGDGSEPDDEGRATRVAADAGDSEGDEGEGSAAGGDIGGAHSGSDVRLPSER